MRLTIPRTVIYDIRTLAASVEYDDSLEPIGPDIWITTTEIPEHTDTTAQGLITWGVILINDLKLELHYKNNISSITKGTIFTIDARKPHAALFKDGIKTNGLFAALIWDVPTTMTMARFKWEASVRLETINIGSEQVSFAVA